MGMFDYIRCEYPLPGVPINILFDQEKDSFQTKCFHNEMSTYTITREGKLIYHTTRMEEVPKRKRPYWGKPQWKKGALYQLAGSMKSVPTGDVFMTITDTINFYTSVGDVNTDAWEWFEWEAVFVDGLLKSIHRLKNKTYK